MSPKGRGPLGRLFGVGVGPGDPELLTLKALRVLKEVDVICYPLKAAGERGRAWEVVAPHLEGGRQETLPLSFPMVKEGPSRERSLRQAALKIASRLRKGKDVAFICLGDVSLYSTFAGPFEFLQRELPGLEAELIPGVPAMCSAAARALFPLALGDEPLLILPATAPRARIREGILTYPALALYKVHRNLEGVLSILEELGLVDRALAIRRCGMEGEEVVSDVRSLRGKPSDYFTTILLRKERGP